MKEEKKRSNAASRRGGKKIYIERERERKLRKAPVLYGYEYTVLYSNYCNILYYSSKCVVIKSNLKSSQNQE